MIPVTQTKVVIKNPHGEMVVRGNCVAACIASLIEKPISEVPNIEVLFHIEDSFWYQVLCKFLNSMGYELSTDDRFKCFHGDQNMEHYQLELKDKFYMVSGKSSRGFNHVCIYQNGNMVHDPYPTKEGLLEETYFESLEKI